MSQQSGVQLYGQSMNGLLELSNVQTIDCYELDAEIINVDNLTVNNSLTVPNISNTTIGTITQSGTNIITQSGTGTNILKNTNITGNLSVSGTLTYDVVDIDCENLIVQNDASLNDVNIIGNIIQTGTGTNILKNTTIGTITQSGTGNNTLKDTTIGIITQTGNHIITQSGTGNNTLKDTTIGIITQTGNHIITQSGTGFNLLKSINQIGGDYISQSGTGNNVLKNITQSVTNIISQTGTGTNILKDTEITGDLRVDNVLQTYDFSIQDGYATNFTQTTETINNIVVLSFSVLPNVSGTFNVGYISPLSIREDGQRPYVDAVTTTTINSCVANLYKNGVLYDTNNASSSNGYGVVQSFTIGRRFNPIPPDNPYSYRKYITTLSSSFRVEHVSSPTTTNYTIELVVNSSRTNPIDTTYYIMLNTTRSNYTQVAVIAFSPALVGNYQATSYTINTESALSIDTGSILCNEIVSNKLYSEYLRVNNVLSTNSNLQLQDFIFNETSFLTSLFVGSATKIYSFEVIGNKRPITFTITYSTPLALSESSSVGLPTVGLRSTINSTSLTLYRNGVLVSTTSGTKTNTTDPKYNITTAGSYNYKQFVNIITGSITFTDDYVEETTSFYELKMSINNTRTNSGGTYGYEANTLSTGITKSANVDNDETFTNYSAGAYTITVANQTPTYSTDTGTLINNSLVNNNLYNKAVFNNLNFVSSSVFTLQTSNSYYLLGRAGNIQINLPYLSNNYTGFTVWLRKAQPTNNINTININASVNGCRYFDNMTIITTNITYNNEEKVISLLYGGSGDWFLLNLL